MSPFAAFATVNTHDPGVHAAPADGEHRGQQVCNLKVARQVAQCVENALDHRFASACRYTNQQETQTYAKPRKLSGIDAKVIGRKNVADPGDAYDRLPPEVYETASLTSSSDTKGEWAFPGSGGAATCAPALVGELSPLSTLSSSSAIKTS
ncbi:MAG: hypothetical protein ACYDD1_14580 [Caulobacteraceae bacterium]